MPAEEFAPVRQHNGSHAKLRGQGPRAEAAAARRLPPLTRAQREPHATGVTQSQARAARGGSAAGAKPGRASFSVKLDAARFKRELFRMINRPNGKIDIKVGPIQMIFRGSLDV